jgi:hypothetical protein
VTNVNMVQGMLDWAALFEAGLLSDPARVDGTLAPGEQFAVRVGPIVAAQLAITPQVEVLEAGPVGTLIATDRRAFVLVAGEVARQWEWRTDVARVTALVGGIGAVWSPTPERHAAGVRLEGVVLPGYVAGERLPADDARLWMPEFMKVTVAWRAGEPGGVDAWRHEFRRRHADLLL